MNELEFKRIEAKQKLADLKFIKLEVEYLVDQLELLDDKATKLLITQLVTYLDHLTLK